MAPLRDISSTSPANGPFGSGLVGAVSEKFRRRSGIALIDQHLRPSREHEWKGTARVIGTDPCVDSGGSKQTLNDLRLVPRPEGAYRYLPAHFRGDDRSLRRVAGGNRPAALDGGQESYFRSLFDSMSNHMAKSVSCMPEMSSSATRTTVATGISLPAKRRIVSTTPSTKPTKSIRKPST
jgi:hypothetical protein